MLVIRLKGERPKLRPKALDLSKQLYNVTLLDLKRLHCVLYNVDASAITVRICFLKSRTLRRNYDVLLARESLSFKKSYNVQ